MKLDRLNYPGQIEQTVSITTTLLENQILSIYLYGSAVLGGLHPDSDIDILVLTNSEMTDRIRAELTRQVMDASGAVGNPEKRPNFVTEYLHNHGHKVARFLKSRDGSYAVRTPEYQFTVQYQQHKFRFRNARPGASYPTTLNHNDSL